MIDTWAHDRGEIVMEEPPMPNRGTNRRVRWVDHLAPLVQSPGEWARVGVYAKATTAYSTARNLRTGRVQVPAGRWDFVGRSVDGEGRVYARYLGPDEK